MRCLVYSSNRLFGQCLANGLDARTDVAKAHALSCAEDIPGQAERFCASMLLVDLVCPTGRAVVPRIARALPDLCLIGLSVDDSVADNVVDCARLGCHAIVPQNADLEDVVEIMRDATCGRVRLRPQVAATMMRALAVAPPATAPQEAIRTSALTRKEREVCQLVCEGMTNKEIAQEVNRSVATIKNHVHSILTKLELSRRSAIPARLISNGKPSIDHRTSA